MLKNAIFVRSDLSRKVYFVDYSGQTFKGLFDAVTYQTQPVLK